MSHAAKLITLSALPAENCLPLAARRQGVSDHGRRPACHPEAPHCSTQYPEGLLCILCSCALAECSDPGLPIGSSQGQSGSWQMLLFSVLPSPPLLEGVVTASSRQFLHVSRGSVCASRWEAVPPAWEAGFLRTPLPPSIHGTPYLMPHLMAMRRLHCWIIICVCVCVCLRHLNFYPW